MTEYLNEAEREAKEFYDERFALMQKPAPVGEQYVAISPQSRNLSVTWTNNVERAMRADGGSFLRVATPGAPTEWGGPRSCAAEIEGARRYNRGNDYRVLLWVGKRPVIAVWDGQLKQRASASEIVSRLRVGETVLVEVQM